MRCGTQVRALWPQPKRLYTLELAAAATLDETIACGQERARPWCGPELAVSRRKLSMILEFQLPDHHVPRAERGRRVDPCAVRQLGHSVLAVRLDLCAHCVRAHRLGVPGPSEDWHRFRRHSAQYARVAASFLRLPAQPETHKQDRALAAVVRSILDLLRPVHAKAKADHLPIRSPVRVGCGSKSIVEGIREV